MLAALIFFVEQWQMPAWVLLIIVAREFAVTALRLIAVDNGRVIAAGIGGKVKTVTTMVCICVMLTPVAMIWIPLGFSVNQLCVAAILVTTVWSGIEYFLQNKDVIQWNA